MAFSASGIAGRRVSRLALACRASRLAGRCKPMDGLNRRVRHDAEGEDTMSWFQRKDDEVEALCAQFAALPVTPETFNERNAVVDHLADIGVYQNAGHWVREDGTSLGAVTSAEDTQVSRKHS